MAAMWLCMLSFPILIEAVSEAVNTAAGTASHLTSAHDPFSGDSGSDFMDKYIKDSGDSGGSVWSRDSSGSVASTEHWTPSAPEQPAKSRLLLSRSAESDKETSDAPADSPVVGAVVDVKLDSELQMGHSLLQRSRVQARSAPSVEDAVAKQRLEDVYIHDSFSKEAAEDEKKVKEVKADPNLKP
mmetsp:Transcript_71012/g.154342  ORF Transcript_71012/g.154342 Transcript_71012/m.154342 type:complete len:185 (-) Transcript_71012:125-679(-)